MFVDKQLVPVFLDEDPENRIFILPKMSFGVRQRMTNTIMNIVDDPNSSAIGAYTLALMRHNIVGWEGPAFEGTPCTPEAIENLDQDEPLVELVQAEIIKRNPLKRPPRGNSPTASGSTSAGGVGSADGSKSP